jgi:dATP pyrophosphohydrolase
MAEPRRNIGIESPGFNACIVKQDEDGWKYLALQRAESETYGGFWGFVTGSRQGDETVAQGVKREVKAETGLTDIRMFATEYLIQFYEPANDRIWILPLIVVVVPPDCEITLSDENQDYDWLTSRRAKHRVSWKNLIRAIDDIADELEVFPARNWVEIFA